MISDTDRIEFLERCLAVPTEDRLTVSIDIDGDGTSMRLIWDDRRIEVDGAPTVRAAIDQCIEKMREVESET